MQLGFIETKTKGGAMMYDGCTCIHPEYKCNQTPLQAFSTGIELPRIQHLQLSNKSLEWCSYTSDRCLLYLFFNQTKKVILQLVEIIIMTMMYACVYIYVCNV